LIKLPDDPKEAIKLQNELRSFVRIRNYPNIAQIRFIGGVDVAYFSRKMTRAYAVAIIWDRLSGEVIERAYAERNVTFPYIPGLLSFRELPIIIDAYDKLSFKADIWMIDGAGVAHPRGLGIAAHFGVVLDLPSIGVAKSRLVGNHLHVPRNKGSWVPLWQDKKVIGHVVRTRNEVRPLYVSPGHEISIRQATELVLACCTRYRLPEPTRLAHHLVTRRAHSL